MVLMMLLGLTTTLAVADDAKPTKTSSKSKSSKSKSSKSKSSKSSKSKTSKSKKPKAPPKPVTPQTRPVLDPVWSDDEEGEGDEHDVGPSEAEPLSPEQALAEVERELLANPPPAEPVYVALEVPVEAPPPPSKPGFIRHEIIPDETLESIAERYGVTPKQIVRWNSLDPKKHVPRSGKKPRRIHTVDPPLPRQRSEHIIKRGDTWEKLAAKHEVDVELLKKWNRGRLKSTLKAGQKLYTWHEPPPPDPTSTLAIKLAQVKVPAGGVSIGRPNRGRLVRGIRPPEQPALYVVRKPEEAYGSSHAIAQLVAAIVRFHHETNYKRPIVIGGISRQKGGTFRPHKSHQSGRDMDIRLPILASAEGKKQIGPNDIDWKASWQLIHAFLRTGEVEYIFLEHPLQKRLYKAARELGTSPEDLARWVQWPQPSKTNKGLVRHVKGHKVHFHVRIRCGQKEAHCG